MRPLWGYPRAIVSLSFHRPYLHCAVRRIVRDKARLVVALRRTPPYFMIDSTITSEIARMFLAGSGDGIVARVKAGLLLKVEPRWLSRLAARYREVFNIRPRHREVVDLLEGDGQFRRALRGLKLRRRVAHEPQGMQPAGPWDIPALTSPAELAAWLAVTDSELEWFANLRNFGASAKLQHYHYQVIEKSRGVRILESPKSRLKAMQRKILAEIIESVPAHRAAHGFVKGRSIQTFAAPHAAKHVVLKMDLCDFFPSIAGVRVQTLFRVFGYPESVADLLGGICTNAVPHRFVASSGFDTRQLYRRPHLPQGAPTSPALANRIAYRVDCRLSGLAESAGAAYTRYADDLAFSGDDTFAQRTDRFAAHVAAILEEEGFAVNFRKTRVMKQGVRQHLAGLVTNVKLNIRREDFDMLKAILTNCVRGGPEGQTFAGHGRFREHLAGRIAFVESVHAARGAKLREIFQRIQWGN